jgi:hypothetical protein
MGTSSEPDPGGVVLSTRKALALMVVGTLLPYLAVYIRNTLDHSYTHTMLFVYAPFWMLTAFQYGAQMPSFEASFNLFLLLTGRAEPVWSFYCFAAWLAFIVGLGILHSRPTRTRILKAAIMLNSAPALLWGLLLVGQVFKYGAQFLVYPLPIPMLPFIGFYVLRGWRFSSPPVVSGEIECPFCRNRLTTGPEGVRIGKSVRCPRCGKTLKVTG